jgi:protein subunit release factor B
MSLQFPVSPPKQAQLLLKMETLGVKESDLEETYIKSSGNGGQNINKVSTAVFLRHKPSGIEVKCSIYRTQGLNRYKARAILCEKLEGLSGESPKKKQILKIQKNKKKKDQKQRKKKRVLEELHIRELESRLEED